MVTACDVKKLRYAVVRQPKHYYIIWFLIVNKPQKPHTYGKRKPERKTYTFSQYTYPYTCIYIHIYIYSSTEFPLCAAHVKAAYIHICEQKLFPPLSCRFLIVNSSHEFLFNATYSNVSVVSSLPLFSDVYFHLTFIVAH